MTFVPSEVFKSILRLGLDRGLDLGPGGVECLWLDRGEDLCLTGVEVEGPQPVCVVVLDSTPVAPEEVCGCSEMLEGCDFCTGFLVTLA